MDPSMSVGVEAAFVAGTTSTTVLVERIMQRCQSPEIINTSSFLLHTCLWDHALGSAPKLHRAPSPATLAKHPQPRLFVFTRIKAMASSTVTAIKCAAVFLAVLSTMAVAANGQAPGPAPPPETGGAGASAVPSILAPAIAMVLAFGVGRLQW